MALQPSQVVSNANSKMLQIERIATDRTRPTPERMAEIAALVDDFRAAVAGSTADPFRDVAATDPLRDLAARVEAVRYPSPHPVPRQYTVFDAAAACTCVMSCADDPASACSLSGTWHVHPNSYPGDVFGPCPVHPDAPGDH